MQLIAYDEKTRESTVKLTDLDLCDIAACLLYLSDTFPEQDSVQLGLPGEEGEARVDDLNNQIQNIIEELNVRLIPGHSR